LCI
ncbi:hypothetical protein D018_3454B, partial [Vibrio parahaemolyticus VP2007-007]|jgi:hypothetical protein